MFSAKVDARGQAVPDARIPAQLLMQRETRVRSGEVPHALLDQPLAEMSWHMKGDEFLLRATGEHYFHYRRGDGVKVERGPGADLTEEILWLNGSVYSAIASMNGLVPIHASAVAHDGAVFAFTGPAGAGKSTLVAGLANHGLPMFCDDTLVLDLSDPDRVVCLPGHKRLKLKADAVTMTGATAQEKVSTTVDKYYSEPTAGHVGGALPLGELIFLEEGAAAAIEPIAGSERFVRMQDDHQTSHLFAAASKFDRAALFAHLARLARQVNMARFTRSLDAARFHEGVAVAARHVRGHLT